MVYLPFSRTPDYFDSEVTPALIEAKSDSVFAVFKESGKTYRVQLDQKRFQSNIGSRIEIRYELSAPEHAKVNQIIGYWLEPKELLGALSILIFLSNLSSSIALLDAKKKALSPSSHLILICIGLQLHEVVDI